MNAKRLYLTAMAAAILLLVQMPVPMRAESKAKKISFTKKVYTVKAGKTLNLKKRLKGKRLLVKTKKWKWKISDRQIATINRKGVIRAKKEGMVKITVKIGKGKKAVCLIRVTAPERSRQNTEDRMTEKNTAENSKTENSEPENSELENRKIDAETGEEQVPMPECFEEKRVFMIPGKAIAESKTGKYISERSSEARAYTYYTIEGTDYIETADICSPSDGYSGKYSSLTMIDLGRVAWQARQECDHPGISEDDIAEIEDFVVLPCFIDQDDDPVWVNIQKYDTASDFAADIENAVEAAGISERVLKESELTNGSKLSREQLIKIIAIWAREMDAWREDNGMGHWDYFLYGDTNHTYNLVTRTKGVVNGGINSGWVTARTCINGAVTVFTR